MEIQHWILAATAALCIGLAKSGFPGVGIFPILLLADIMPARESTGALLPLLVCGDLFALFIYRQHAQWLQIARIIPPAFIGIVLGYLLMPQISNDWFRPLIGWIVLSMVLLQYLRKRLNWEKLPQKPYFGLSAGILSGVTTMLANAAGPIMALYLLSVGLPKLAFVGTSACFFLIINVIKIPFSMSLGLINASSLSFDLVLVPFVGLGIILGRALIQRIPQRTFELLVLLFALVAALRLIFLGS